MSITRSNLHRTKLPGPGNLPGESSGNAGADESLTYRNSLKRGVVMAKRIRHVFPSDEIPHLWAHQSQDSARASRIFFEGLTIYSYGHHFPIARIVYSNHTREKDRKKAILFTSEGYSNSTGKHKNLVRRAISHELVFTVPLSERYGMDTDSAVHFRHYQEEVNSEYEKAKKAREYSESHYNQMMSQFQEACAYAKFFRIKCPVKLPVTGRKLREFQDEVGRKVRHAEELRLSRIERQPELDRKRREKWEKKNQELLAHLAVQMEDWKNGVSDYPPRLPYQRGMGYQSRQLPVMLRIKGDEVQTSMGARFPVTHAIRGLALVESCISSKREYKRNGHTVHLGNYSIDRVSAEGTVYAGCHVVEWREIERIKPELLQRAAMITAAMREGAGPGVDLEN